MDEGVSKERGLGCHDGSAGKKLAKPPILSLIPRSHMIGDTQFSSTYTHTDLKKKERMFGGRGLGRWLSWLVMDLLYNHEGLSLDSQCPLTKLVVV